MADFARSAHPGVQAQLDRLATLSPAGDRLGLERIALLLDRLGRPHDLLPPVFHVAGTNGKGSTVAFLRAALEAAGCTVHAFTSPHLARFNERIRVAGQLIGDEPLAALLGEVLDSGGDIEPSFFEAATAAALLAFARTPADACILEVGLGGRLDATNVVDRPAVTGIANLALDHQQWLGTTLAQIAAEKAGIAKAGVPLVFLAYPQDARAAVIEAAANAGAPAFAASERWSYRAAGDGIEYRDEATLTVPLPTLPGAHQVDNCALAIAMLRHQQAIEVPLEALRRMPLEATWPARMQRLAAGPLVGRREAWLDGGHNPAAARYVADFARAAFSDGQPLDLIFACLAVKDPIGMLEPFRGIAAQILTVPVADHDCIAPVELADLANKLGFAASAHESLEAALAQISEDARVLIFGSLYLAGEALAANREIPD